MIAELSWDWECHIKKTPVKQNSKVYFHPHIQIWQDVTTGNIVGNPQDESLFWFLVLEEKGGFLPRSIFETQRKVCADVATKIILRKEQGMQLIPLGKKEALGHLEDFIRCCMTDDRIPVWNPLCLRLIVAASDFNAIFIHADGSKKILSPWKQRRDCIVIEEISTPKRWKFEKMTEIKVREEYPLSIWLPKTKTARQAMEKDTLYLICTLFDKHPPKWTKKAMLELL